MNSFMENSWTLPKRRIYTISEFTRDIKELIETAYPFVWVAGEISNLSRPVSGHFYFTLKDDAAQISSVMFRGQSRNVKFQLNNGMAVIAMGRMNVYEARGVYQIIVEYVEPVGVGALQLAFQQLKGKLSSEGLFDEDKKRPLPFLPRKVTVITSPTGAVIRDILNVLNRRFPGVSVEVVPVRVQGEGADDEIVQALRLLVKRGGVELVVLSRGGGSLEDLQAFNSEGVARAISSFPAPVVSAVGHETDFTIADFVADVRAPTPSAAAELIVPEKKGLAQRLLAEESRLGHALAQRIGRLREGLFHISRRLVHPERQIADHRLRLGDLEERMHRGAGRLVGQSRDRLDSTGERLLLCNPIGMVKNLNVLLEHYRQTVLSAMQMRFQSKKAAFQTVLGKMNGLNPLAVLERGYSITRTVPGFHLVKDVNQVDVGEKISVKVARGNMECRVERKRPNGQAKDI